MLKDLVVVIQDGELSRSAVAQAMAFAELRQAHLEILLVTERVLLSAPFDPAGVVMADDRREEAHRKAMHAVMAQTAGARVPCTVRGLCEERAFLPGLADLECRCTDLVLIPPAAAWSGPRLRRQVIDAVLIHAAAPVLLFPADWTPRPIRYAVIGWNESGEAARAVRSMLPLVEPDATIDVTMIEPLLTPDGRGPRPGRALLVHLARHGLAARLHQRSKGDLTVAGALAAYAVEAEADLLAIGAYASSRFGELIFGGTTRRLMDEDRLPILMVH